MNWKRYWRKWSLVVVMIVDEIEKAFDFTWPLKEELWCTKCLVILHRKIKHGSFVRSEAKDYISYCVSRCLPVQLWDNGYCYFLHDLRFGFPSPSTSEIEYIIGYRLEKKNDINILKFQKKLIWNSYKGNNPGNIRKINKENLKISKRN